MRKETFSFLSKDGKTKIHAVKWIPDSGEYGAVLQITHGMIEFVERYQDFASYLTEHGFLVVGHDHLGHGASVASRADWGYFAPKNPSDILIEDMHTLRTMIQKDNPDVPYFMLGHSMGSYMLRKYLAFHNDHLAGAIIMGTGYMPQAVTRAGLILAKLTGALRGSHYRSRMLENLTFGAPYKRYDLTGKDTANSWLTKDAKIVKWYYSEPSCTFRFTANGYQGLTEAVLFSCNSKNIDTYNKELPVFLVAGADDPVGNMGEGVKIVCEMFQKAGIRDVSCKLYADDRHEILNETDKETVYKDILDWMEERKESHK